MFLIYVAEIETGQQDLVIEIRSNDQSIPPFAYSPVKRSSPFNDKRRLFKRLRWPAIPSDHNVSSHSATTTGGEGKVLEEGRPRNKTGHPGWRRFGDEVIAKGSDRSVPETWARVTYRRPRRQPRRDARIRGDNGPCGILLDNAGLHPHNRVARNEEGRTDTRCNRERRRRRVQQG